MRADFPQVENPCLFADMTLQPLGKRKMTFSSKGKSPAIWDGDAIAMQSLADTESTTSPMFREQSGKSDLESGFNECSIPVCRCVPKGQAKKSQLGDPGFKQYVRMSLVSKHSVEDT